MWKKIILILVIGIFVLTGAAGVLCADNGDYGYTKYYRYPYGCPWSYGNRYGDRQKTIIGNDALCNEINIPQAEYTVNLTEVEIDSLQFIREEEKLAHDVYTILYEEWGIRIFSRITESEQRHTDAVKVLLDRYNVEDPYIEGVGNFTDQSILDLYNWLTGWGLQSPTDAILVGIYIEEYDIIDLWKAYDETEKADIQNVYQSLYEGSYNHLDAYTNNYEKLTGIAFDPDQDDFDLLTQEEFDNVLSLDSRG